MAVLTLERCKELQNQLEKLDAEIDSVINTYYLTPGGQNVSGHIGEISALHARLVEHLSDVRRELEAKKQ